MSIQDHTFAEYRRNTLMYGTASELAESRSRLEDAPIEELFDALEERARKSQSTAWTLIRRELRGREAEGGCMPALPKTIAEHREQVAERHAEQDREHYTYGHSSVVGKHIMRKNGYRPRVAIPVADPTPSPMSNTSTHALTLVADPQFAVAKNEIKKLQATAVAQIRAVNELEGKAALGAIIAGLTLHRAKASMAHGTFRPWIEQMSTGSGHLAVKKSQANYYMRLALVFLEKTKVAKPDLLALPGDQTALDLGDNHPAKKFVQKLTSFVGDLSLNELLIKHGIKGVGLKTELSAEQDEGELTPAQKAQQARDQAWQEAWNSAQMMRASLTEPEKVSLISDPKQIELLKGEVVEINKLLDDRLAALRAVNV